MFLNTASPRRSFSIPININLQGARRRQTREFLHATAAQERDWSRGLDGRGGQRARSQVPGSSVGEDRAVLLGCAMMAFSVLMFFVVGINSVKPYISGDWTKTSCVLLKTSILKDWVDCRGLSTVPCLRAEVNLTETNQTAFLHYDEESLLFNLECFYLPKCQMNRTELRREAERVKTTLDAHLHNSSWCFADLKGRPGVATLRRKQALVALLWPGLMLGGGALLVGLVKLTQHLARLSSDVLGEAAAAGGGSSRSGSRHKQGKLYRLLQRSSASSPS